MNGDGRADYVWIDPKTGEIRCWLNNIPEPWTPAGTNNSIIGSGAGRGETIYLADMNGDGRDDYLVIKPRNGAVRVFWNYGADDSWENGWKFVDGGVIASGVPHANLATLRFPDINGDGRADYRRQGRLRLDQVQVWLNMYPQQPAWRHIGIVKDGVRGTAGAANTRFAKLTRTRRQRTGSGRADYVVVEPGTGAAAAWLNGLLHQVNQYQSMPS
ncbi:hypothetical protein MY3296_000273 [Beauveria thailandica]